MPGACESGPQTGGDTNDTTQRKSLASPVDVSHRAEAAEAAGIGESTLRAYLREPEFQARYREAFGALVQDATRQAQQAIAPALSTLREIVEDENAGAKARIMAARSTLEYALRLTEQLDIISRIETLEHAMKEGMER